jgi:hypothetical protein
MKRAFFRLEAKTKKMSRAELERLACYVVVSVYGDCNESGNIFLDSKRDRDNNDIAADIREDIESFGLRPQDL